MLGILTSRKRYTTKLFMTAFLGLSAMVMLPSSHASDYPNQPIEVIIPNPPGGGTDILGRMILNETAKSSGWNLIPLNRSGAAGAIGLDATARAKPNGYTIALGETSNLAINPALYEKLSYDPLKDLSPILLLGTVPLVMVVPADSPYKTAKEFIAAAKKEELTLGSAGNGTVGHLAGAMLEQASQIKMLHVPYKGAAPVLTDLMAGRVAVFFGSYPSVRSYVKSGKLRALAVLSDERTPLLPDVPTLVESGLEGFNATVWYGLVAPVGVEKDRLEKITTTFTKALSNDEMRERLKLDGLSLDLLPSDKFKILIEEDMTKWERVIKAGNVTIG